MKFPTLIQLLNVIISQLSKRTWKHIVLKCIWLDSVHLIVCQWNANTLNGIYFHLTGDLFGFYSICVKVCCFSSFDSFHWCSRLWIVTNNSRFCRNRAKATTSQRMRTTTNKKESLHYEKYISFLSFTIYDAPLHLLSNDFSLVRLFLDCFRPFYSSPFCLRFYFCLACHMKACNHIYLTKKKRK